MLPYNVSRSCLLCSLFQRLCQNPWHLRFLNMNADVGRESGCFDMAPYETKCASCPRKRDIAVVTGPLTQFSIRRIGCTMMSLPMPEKTLARTTLLAVRPSLHLISEGFVVEVVVCQYFRRAQACELMLEQLKIAASANLRMGHHEVGWLTYRLRTKFRVFRPLRAAI